MQLHPLVTDRWKIEILERSRRTLTIRTHKPLEVGALVQLRTPSTFILGEVRYCVKGDGCFRSEVKIEDTLRKPQTA